METEKVKLNRIVNPLKEQFAKRPSEFLQQRIERITGDVGDYLSSDEDFVQRGQEAFK